MRKWEQARALEQEAAENHEMSPEETDELLARIEESDNMRPTPAYTAYKDGKSGKGRWRIVFEWDGGSIIMVVSSLSKARRIVRGVKGEGAKYAFYLRNKRKSRWLHKMLEWKR